ncbi:MAG: hypothetical protein ACM33B_01385 [Pseudomonadota bacterium]
MNGLERDLQRLRETFPPTPDLAVEVRRRIEGVRPGRSRRPLVVAVAVALVAAAAVLAASPDARSTLRDWLGIGGAEVVRVEELPAVRPQRGTPAFGDPVTRGQAAAAVSFPLRFPAELGEPDAIYLRREVAGGMVVAVYGHGPRYRAVFAQWIGAAAEMSFFKVAGGGTTVERVRVDGGRGVWLEGAPHEVYWIGSDGKGRGDEVFLAGNVLLWESGPLSYRLEAEVSRSRALELAGSLREGV